MKRIVFYNSDGSINTILNPVKKEFLFQKFPQLKQMTEDEYLEFVVKRDAPHTPFSGYVFLEKYDIPGDKTYRDCWILKDGMIIMDQAKIDRKKQLVLENKNKKIRLKQELTQKGFSAELADHLIQ